MISTMPMTPVAPEKNANEGTRQMPMPVSMNTSRMFSRASGVMGIVLIMPRAWDLSMGFSCLLLYVSYSMPALLKFMGNFVLSVLTGFPIIGAWLHSPLMAHAIGLFLQEQIKDIIISRPYSAGAGAGAG